MRMTYKTVEAKDVFPLLGVFDTVAVSRKGTLTMGWEITFPTAYTVEEKDYDDILSKLNAAIKILPEWSLIHRQDLYTYKDYHSPQKENKGYLEACYDENFEGRRYLTHRSFLFVSLATRSQIEKGGQYSGLFGIHGSISVPSMASFRSFIAKCDEFMATFSTGGKIQYRKLNKEDWLGAGENVGIVQRYMMLGNESRVMSHIQMSPDSISVHNQTAQAFVIGESDALPNEIDSVSKVEKLSGTTNSVYLSFASPIGILMDCEHVVNQFIVVPSQQECFNKLDKEKNKMMSGYKSADNRVNGGEIEEFLDDVQRYGLQVVKTHINVIAWSDEDDRETVTGMVSSALSSMGVSATYNKYNTPVIWYAGIPSNAFEIGKENLMLMEQSSSLTLAPYETFEKGIPGGILHFCDRSRHIPITLDTQLAARKAGLINNYNMFVLGGSGSGKSFFMNLYARCCYNAGESVFLIDVGDSYQGLCSLINEQSGGRDGAYLSWDKDHPFSFNPFIGLLSWDNGAGGLNTDDPGVNFFMSFLQTAWAPEGGWSSDTKVILTQFITDFIAHIRRKNIKEPVFDHFYRFLDENIVNRILYEAPTKTSTGKDRTASAIEKDEKTHGYWIGSIHITKKLFNIEKFLLALKNYTLSGSYGFLLNDPHPRDLFTSRFTVFEVDKLSNDDPKFYSLCILCITNAFERKMRMDETGFKNIIIDEAWKAIANETMAPYLASLWKTARKFRTAAVVVTQEVADILNSAAVKTAIIDNSSIKVLLEQSNHVNTFGPIQELLSLTVKDKNLVLSINRDLDPRYHYKEVFFNLGSKLSFVVATEVSPQEAVAYESEKASKEPFLTKAAELGSYVAAIDEITGRNDKKNNE